MEAAAEPKSGACHQVFWRRRLKMETSNSWETMKAVPEASAMRSGAKMAERMRPTAKPTQGKPAVPILEIGGFFETQSEAADAKVVEDFRLALSNGGVLQNVTTTQRDNPERVDGKTEQVALRFAMRAEWPVGGVAPVEAAKKPVAQ